MALSNIFREPRREITESVVGLCVFAVFALADWWFASWLADCPACGPTAPPWVLRMLLSLLVGVMLVILGCGVLLFTHALGDAICNALQARGIHLRPRERG